MPLKTNKKTKKQPKETKQFFNFKITFSQENKYKEKTIRSVTISSVDVNEAIKIVYKDFKKSTVEEIEVIKNEN